MKGIGEIIFWLSIVMFPVTYVVGMDPVLYYVWVGGLFLGIFIHTLGFEWEKRRPRLVPQEMEAVHVPGTPFPYHKCPQCGYISPPFDAVGLSTFRANNPCKAGCQILVYPDGASKIAEPLGVKH